MTEYSERKHRGVALPALIAGGVSAILLAFSMTPTFSAITAQIVNNDNTAGTGTLTMQESDGKSTCNSTDGGSISTNSATCSSINKFGGDLAMSPSDTSKTSITVKNTGTIDAASFTLQGGACTQAVNGSTGGTATDLCAKYDIVIKSGTSTVYSGTAAALAGQTIDLLALLGKTSVAAGETMPLTIEATLNASAGNAYQGLKISQPLTWTFGA